MQLYNTPAFETRLPFLKVGLAKFDVGWFTPSWITMRASRAEQAEWFATTHWSVVLSAADSVDARGDEALEELCRTYWQPLYSYVRRRGHGPEDAQDLTQAFFEQFL